MRNVRLFRALLGVDQRTVIEDIEFEEFEEDDADGDTLVVARVRPRSGVSRRCGRCGRRAPWYDRGEGRRRWRGLDWGTVQVVLEAAAPRVNCPTHGPTVVAVPWARHHAGHTLAFDDTVAWLAVACSKTAVCELMRVAWRTGLGRQDRHPAVSRLPAQRGPAACVFGQGRRRQGSPGPVDLLGTALPHSGIRRAGRPHQATPPSHRRRPRPPPIPRTDRRGASGSADSANTPNALSEWRS